MPNVESTMREFKESSLHSGSKSGPRVTNRKQAAAIALAIAINQARLAGQRLPKSRASSRSR